MAAASRSLATAQWRERFASGLLHPSYTMAWDTISPPSAFRPKPLLLRAA